MPMTPLRRCLWIAGALCLIGVGACDSSPTSPSPSAKPAAQVAKAAPAQPEPASKPPAPASSKSQDPASESPGPAGSAKPPHAGLLDPSQATGQGPDEYAVKFTTTKGDFTVDVHRAWAPIGADRFYQLVKVGYFDDVAFFRVVAGFMAQLGIHGNPQVNDAWRNQRIIDDPVVKSNKRGYVSFATSGPNSRVNQFFINFGDNARLDPMGFAPFGKVRDMATVDALHAGYGEGAPRGRGPSQALMQRRGNEYLRSEFPKLDYVVRATIVD